MDPIERQSYESDLKHYRDYHNTINTAKQEGELRGELEGLAEGELKGKREGLAEGKLEGLAEGQLDIARKMKAKGLGSNTIVKLTGLSKTQVDKA